MLGGSKYQGVKTLFRYTAFTGLAGFVAWVAHPYLLDVVGYALDLNWRESSVTPFQNSFFSVLSLLFAIFSGNSMGFLYDVSRSVALQPPALLLSPRELHLVYAGRLRSDSLFHLGCCDPNLTVRTEGFLSGLAK